VDEVIRGLGCKSGAWDEPIPRCTILYPGQPLGIGREIFGDTTVAVQYLRT